jgi:molecular chaperone DnaJ
MATAAKSDYYEVLGVEKDADDEAIRQAFRARAREWHPDLAPAEDAEARFRELAEAYSVLSKSESRLLYDRYGYRGRGNQGFDDALSEGRERVERGENVHLALELKSFEADQGTRRLVSYEADVRCEDCQGRGVIGEPCASCAGSGTVASERKLRLIIPAGIVNGSQLRVSGDGNYAGWGSVPGDLLVDVKVIPAPRDPRFVRYLALTLLLVAIATLAIYVLAR